MTNWESETNKIKFQQQITINSRIEAEKQGTLEREKKVQNEIKNNYENIILPGFEILDSFNIKETLTEIRDQIWKTGEIFKRPNNFEEYKNRSEYIPKDEVVNEPRQIYNWAYDANSKNLPSPGQKPTEGTTITRNFTKSKLAKYILICPNILEYVPYYSGYCSDDSVSEHIASIDKKLVIVSDTKNIFIYDGCDTVYKKNSGYIMNGESINIEGKNKTDINKWIKETLLKDCVNRRDYTKLGNDVLSHSDLYREYLGNNHSQPPQKRSFFR